MGSADRLDMHQPLNLHIANNGLLKQYSVGFEIVTVSTTGDNEFHKKTSGDYRCGFCYSEIERVPAGVYNIIPTTFLPHQEGPFFLDFHSTIPLKITQLQ